MDIHKKTILLYGTGRKAEEKLEKLAPFGADIIHKTEGFQESDLDLHPVFVIAAEEDLTANTRIADACKARHIHVNAVDQPSDCTFIFPAMINTENVSIAVSSGGKSPAAAVEIRNIIRDSIPEHIDEILDAMVEIRSHLKEQDLQGTALKEALQEIVQQSFLLDRAMTCEEAEYIAGLL